MSKLQTIIKNKQSRYKQNGITEVFKKEDGAIDLASIMVGVIVIGLIGGVIAATVFAVIPWSQDNAAKQQLDSIVQAENAYFGLSAATPSPLPSGTPANSFGKSAELQTANLLTSGPRYCVTTPDDKKSYTGYSQSSSGTIFMVTDKNSKPDVFTPPSGMTAKDALPTDCQFITIGMTTPAVTPTPTASPTPTPYVDPTPTKLIMTYQCDTATTVAAPVNNGTGTYTWTNTATGAIVYTGSSNSSPNLTAGLKYTFVFEGTFTSLNSNSITSQTAGAPCIRSVDHWGTATGTTSAHSGFKGATNLVSVPSNIPSTITSMAYMFDGATSLNDPDIKGWDVSKVANMSYMFQNAASFNQDLSTWNTGLVTDMSYMFNGATAMNGNLNAWNTVKVTNMDRMFYGASSFNQPLNNWNTSNVTNMMYMFFGAPYSQDLTGWDMNKVNKMAFMMTDPDSKLVSRTTHPNMFRLTYQCDANTVVAAPVNNGTGNYSWSTGSTSTSLNSASLISGTKYTFIFEGTFTGLNSNTYTSQTAGAPCIRSVDHWGTATGTISAYKGFQGATNLISIPSVIPSTITTMGYMFDGATKLNSSNIRSWDTAKVNNMSYMFQNAASFNQDLTSWDTSLVTDMSYMFNGATAMNGNLNTWNTIKVTNMMMMFQGTSFNQPLNNWNTSNVTNMMYMFFGAPYNQDLTNWDMNKVTRMAFMMTDPDSKLVPRTTHPNMFRITYQCDTNTSVAAPVNNGTGNYSWSTGSTSTSISSPGLIAGTKYTFIFEGTFSGLTSTFYSSQIAGAPCIRSVDFWGTATGTTSASNGFKGATNLISIPSVIPSTITNMSYMFSGATKFNDPNIKGWDVSKVTNMTYMFQNATSFNQDLKSSWNTAAVTNGTFFAPASFPDAYMPANTSK